MVCSISTISALGAENATLSSPISLQHLVPFYNLRCHVYHCYQPFLLQQVLFTFSLVLILIFSLAVKHGSIWDL